MDKAILISILILAAVSLLEIGCLFCCSKLRSGRPPIAAAVPVIPGDNELSRTLDHFGEMLSRGGCCIDRLILIDYGADQQQLKLCREFCKTFPGSELIRPEDLENILAETFAISVKK